ncbi:MAG: ABC transporter [Gemmatales bacterium]|nr:MAG: ABC transporter [Gemmatales bacterium]
MLRRVPLAWINLVADKRRCLVCVGGIAFAVLLMFMQIGFLNALLDGTVAIIDQFDADIVLTSRSKYSLVVNAPFDRHYLYAVQGFEGVSSAAPLFIEYARSMWRLPGSGLPPRPIRAIGFDPGQPVFLLPEVNRSAPLLKRRNTVLFDAKSKDIFGQPQVGQQAELGNQAVELVGLFELGTDFVNDGNVLMSDRTFARLFPRARTPYDSLSYVELGLVRLEPEADVEAVKKALSKAVDPELSVFTKEEYRHKERHFWLTHTPVGFVFGLGTAIGFIVGMVICYQILSSDVADHLAEYATLKAIGYRDAYLNLVVLQEGVYLALMGFVPGWFASYLLYVQLSFQTGLPMRITWPRGVLVFVLTLLMCVLSGLLAVRKVRTADPADVF